MTVAVFYKLLAIFVTVALGWVAGRMRWLGTGNDASDPARVLGNAAFYIFVPALMFRTSARLDFGALPWLTVVAYFVPALLLLFAVYAWQRRRAAADRLGPAAPAVRAISANFGNSVQVGIPLSAALFGEIGLGIHISIVSLHALVLLTVPTALAEIDLARVRGGGRPGSPSLARTLLASLRNTVVHPVVLPVLAGLAWNLTGWGLHPVLDEALAGLGSAVVPLCLVLIGMTLAYYGVQGALRGALLTSALKLLLMPALVLVVARWGFGLDGVALAVIVMMAALPVGSNALLFAQRYDTLEVEANAAIVVSTLGFVGTGTLWLGVLTLLAG